MEKIFVEEQTGLGVIYIALTKYAKTPNNKNEINKSGILNFKDILLFQIKNKPTKNRIIIAKYLKLSKKSKNVLF